MSQVVEGAVVVSLDDTPPPVVGIDTPDATTSVKGKAVLLGGTAAAPTVPYSKVTGAPTIPTIPPSLPPSGGAGGVLSGSYPSPGFAVDMATQAELNAAVAAVPDQVFTKLSTSLVAGSNITITVDDGLDKITITSTSPPGGGGTVTFGTTAGTAAEGNDPRLSNSRVPTGTAGGVLAGTYPNPSFAVSMATASALSTGLSGKSDTAHVHDYAATAHTHSYAATSHTHGVTDLTATGTKDGTKFLRDDNTWSVPVGGGTAFTSRSVSANTTAVAGEVLKVSASSGQRTITPPTSPTAGTTVTVVKTDNSTNTVLWNATVNGDTDGARLTTEDCAATFTYDGTEWLLTSVNTAFSASAAAAVVSVAGRTGAVTLAKADVGLPNVDNTSDVAKPVSTAQAAVNATKLDIPIANALHEVNFTKLRWSRIEAVTLAATTEQTLLNVTGPGRVESIWMAVDKVAAVDGRLRVYYDGSVTPTIDIDAGTLWASHYSPPNPVNTPHMAFDMKPDAANSNFPAGYYFSFPIPFGTSIKIGFYSPSGATAAFYSQVAYRLTATDTAGGKRLRAAGNRYADQAVTRTAGATNTLANITGGAGALVWHSYVGGAGATNRTWMERNIELTIDGEGTPSILATGTEDWFDGAWYYGDGRSSVNTSFHSYVATDMPIGATQVVGMATDLLSKWGGIPFTSSCLVRALPEAMCTTGDTFVSCFLYYQ